MRQIRSIHGYCLQPDVKFSNLLLVSLLFNVRSFNDINRVVGFHNIFSHYKDFLSYLDSYPA